MGRRKGDRSFSATAAVPHPSGLLVRPGTLDSFIVEKEVPAYTRLVKPRQDDVLLDIGLNIGAVSAAYLAAGVDRVHGYEPEPVNCALARMNLAQYGERAVVTEAAVVGADDPPTMILKVSESPNQGSHALLREQRAVPNRTVTPVVVDTVTFGQALEDADPTVVKIDIEGGEYAFADHLGHLPDRVRALVVEWHLRKGRDPLARANSAQQGILASGFSLAHGPEHFVERMSWVRLCCYLR